MDRKFLEAKGLEKDVIDSIMAEHGKAVQAAKPTEDYETLKSQNDTLSQQIVDLNNSVNTASQEKEDLAKQVNGYKHKELKGRIAHEFNLPFELAGRLSGETEEELKEDAKSLSSFIAVKPILPLGSIEPEDIEEHKYSNQSRIIAEQYQSE